MSMEISISEARRIHTHPCRLNRICERFVICVCHTPKIDPKVFCTKCQMRALKVRHETKRKEIAGALQGDAQEERTADHCKD